MSNILGQVSSRVTPRTSMVENPEADEALARMGYKQELKRTRSTAHVVFMCFVLASIPYGLSTTMLYSLPNGGPATILWGWVFLIAITLCVAVSLGEICSAYPTAGGVYYQTFMVAPRKWRIISSWICGWAFVVGNVMITLAVQFGTASFLVGCINIFKDSEGLGIFQADAYELYGVFVGVVIVCSLISTVFNRWLHLLDTFAIFWTFAGVLALIVCVLAIAKEGRHSGAYAFGHFDSSNSGWPSGWAFFVGLLQAAYACSSTGMVVSMCEEVEKPEIQVPRAMVMTIVINGIAGVFFLLPLNFVMPDLAYLSSTGQPVPEIVLSAVGNEAGAFCLMIPLIVLGFICGTGCTTAACRSVWAFSRDGAVPGYKLWRQVNSKFDVPLNSMILITLIQLLFGLISLGSTAAFNAFSGVGVICLGLSYWVPIFTSFAGGREHVKGAVFNLGKIGYFSNIVAIVWFMFAIPLFCFPTTIPVDAETMNYASVVFVGFTILSVVYYFVHGKDVYQGPPTGEPKTIDPAQQDLDEGFQASTASSREKKRDSADEELENRLRANSVNKSASRVV